MVVRLCCLSATSLSLCPTLKRIDVQIGIIISIFGKLGYLGTYIPIPRTTDGGELQMSSMNIGFFGTVLIPSILYSICVRNAAKRLRGMGYNRFSSLLTVIPFIGPAVLIWLAFTISKKKQKLSE